VNYYLPITVLLAHTENEAQKLFDLFSNADRRFALTVSLKKTEVMLQPTIRHNRVFFITYAGRKSLKASFYNAVEKSILTNFKLTIILS